MPAMPCCPCDSTTGLETKAPRGIDHGLTRAGSRCARCHNDGAADQIDDHEHFYLFQACECHKCDLFSDLPAESALKMDPGPPVNRHLTRRLTKSAAAPPRRPDFVKKMTIQGTVLRDLPRDYADRSSPKLFVSILDSSTLEDATDNFSFRDFPEAPCPEQLVPTASDQASASPASEWQRKLEAAEALLILRASPQAPSGSVSQLQP